MGFFDLFKRSKTPKAEQAKQQETLQEEIKQPTPQTELLEQVPQSEPQEEQTPQAQEKPQAEEMPQEEKASQAEAKPQAQETPKEESTLQEDKTVQSEPIESKPQSELKSADSPESQNTQTPPQGESKEKLNEGLSKSKTSLFDKIKRAVAGRSTVDAAVLDDLEEILVTSDVGVETTIKIIERVEERVARDKYLGASELQRILREEVAALMEQASQSQKDFGIQLKTDGVPYVVMVVGVNGVGKTTTIGKLAAKLTALGHKVYIGAADTFRAAAIEQLGVWAERAGATMVRQEMGSDPASVAFDTLSSAVANGADVVLIDTAGRLHNKVGLMNELSKIRKVMSKVIPDAPHEVMLVLDGSTGQNAFEQAKHFTEATQVTSLTITKLDGTAKGGVVIGISDQFHIPVRYIGVGEGIDQLQIFDRHAFVEALMGK